MGGSGWGWGVIQVFPKCRNITLITGLWVVGCGQFGGNNSIWTSGFRCWYIHPSTSPSVRPLAGVAQIVQYHYHYSWSINPKLYMHHIPELSYLGHICLSGIPVKNKLDNLFNLQTYFMRNFFMQALSYRTGLRMGSRGKRRIPCSNHKRQNCGMNNLQYH